MNLKKTFSNQTSIILIFVISILGITSFFIIQNQIVDLEKESIKREKELKQTTERILFDLRTTLNSRLDNETKARESLLIIEKLRNVFDAEYIYLRTEAQNKVDEIRNRIDQVEEKILQEDFEGASEIVDEIIVDLESRDTLADSTDDNNDSGGNNNENPDINFTFDPNTPDQGSGNSQQGGENNNQDGEVNNVTPLNTNEEEIDNKEDEDEGDQNPNYGPGIKPKVDRNKNDREENESELIELQVGD